MKNNWDISILDKTFQTDLTKLLNYSCQEQHLLIWNTNIYLCYKIRILLTWDRAHADHFGNELADTLAKEAITDNKYSFFLPLPTSHFKYILKRKLLTDWKDRWVVTHIHSFQRSIWKLFYHRETFTYIFLRITLLILWNIKLTKFLYPCVSAVRYEPRSLYPWIPTNTKKINLANHPQYSSKNRSN